SHLLDLQCQQLPLMRGPAAFEQNVKSYRPGHDADLLDIFTALRENHDMPAFGFQDFLNRDMYSSTIDDLNVPPVRLQLYITLATVEYELSRLITRREPDRWLNLLGQEARAR